MKQKIIEIIVPMNFFYANLYEILHIKIYKYLLIIKRNNIRKINAHSMTMKGV